MNTYIPFPDFHKSAEVLDDRRLNRQRSDISSLLKSLTSEPDEDDHPLVKMWRGHERFLIRYGMAICFEWQSRGNADQTLEKIIEYNNVFGPETDDVPEWWGREHLHLSHQSHLLRSQPSHYRDKFPDVRDDIPMIWPRSPERSRKTKERRERDRLIKKAYAAREKAHAADIAARDAAIAAGLDPDTMEAIPDSELQVENIRTPDDDLLEL